MAILRLAMFVLLVPILLGGLCAAARGAEADRPNFVFLFVDDLGWRDLGCYGSSQTRPKAAIKPPMITKAQPG